jgi:hypothetical protein
LCNNHRRELFLLEPRCSESLGQGVQSYEQTFVDTPTIHPYWNWGRRGWGDRKIHLAAAEAALGIAPSGGAE